MKVFLRNTQTGCFFQEPHGWTPEQEVAHDLANLPRAVDLIFAARLENVEILLCHDDPRYDLVLSASSSPFRRNNAKRQL
jgi:hypothetical protein